MDTHTPVEGTGRNLCRAFQWGSVGSSSTCSSNYEEREDSNYPGRWWLEIYQRGPLDGEESSTLIARRPPCFLKNDLRQTCYRPLIWQHWSVACLSLPLQLVVYNMATSRVWSRRSQALAGSLSGIGTVSMVSILFLNSMYSSFMSARGLNSGL